MLNQFYLLLLSLLLLLVYEGARIAFIYSFKYRVGKEHDGLVEKCLANLYCVPGIVLASFRLMSTLAFLFSIYLEHGLLRNSLMFSEAWLQTLVVALCVVLTYVCFGFVLPRVLFGTHPDVALQRCAVPIYIIGVILIPLTRLLLWFPRIVLKLFKIKLTDNLLAQLIGGKVLMDADARPPFSVEQPELKEKDQKIFRNALEFSNVRVRDCIVPRTEIVAVEIGDKLSDLMHSFIRSGKTKVIVYQEDLDHVLGYVHSSDLFRDQVRNDWTTSVRQIPIVPESMSAQKMMQIFMQQKKSIAVVADEFGGTSGIISLEDLVEEIFGDIEDEHDVVTYTARKLSDQEYMLSARLEIEKVNEQFGLNIPESDDYLTIGGFILHHYQDFPKSGQIVKIDNYAFTIIKTSVSKIDLVKLKVIL